MPERIVLIPEGVEVKFEGNELVVKGPKGELRRMFKHMEIEKKIESGKIFLSTKSKRKKVNALLGTWQSHMRNMITGVTRGWEAKLKIIYSHFPMKVMVEGDRVIISNFLGEKSPRSSRILGNTKVDVRKDEIVVTGIDKELVGQSAANIETATKITRFDRRVFQDGCHMMQNPIPMGEAK